MAPPELEAACKLFLESLKITPEEITNFEMNTRLQADSELWHERRNKMLTASSHAKVCCQLEHTLGSTIVHFMLYVDLSGVASIVYGRQMEPIAKEIIENTLNITIEPAGLFICEEFPFLGATPDGLIGENQIVEIKCPYSARTMTPEEGIAGGQIKCWRRIKSGKNGEVKLEFNKRDKWYYQIQSQLHYTKRASCLFDVYTPHAPFIKWEVIERDEFFYSQ